MWPVVSRWELGADPFTDLHRLNREIGRLFEAPAGTQAPPLDIWGTDDQLQVAVDLPGVEPDKIELSVADGVLTIAGERPKQALEETDTAYRAERPAGRFSRSVRLPFDVEQDQIKARYHLGSLFITLPKAEAAKPRRITVETEA
jgi:HSP20 family protein